MMVWTSILAVLEDDDVSVDYDCGPPLWLCWRMMICLLTTMVSTFTLAVLEDDDVSVDHNDVNPIPGCVG